MIACVSPALMVRSTPLRISLAPPSAATETCRSLISKVDMWWVLRGLFVVGCASGTGDGQLGLHRRLKPLAQLGQGDLGQDLVEEAAHHQAPGDVLGDAAA